MNDPSWTSLAESFSDDVVRWHVVAVDADGGRVRLEPHLAIDALRRRLDDVLGAEAWAVQLQPWGEHGLVAEMTIRGVSRAAVVHTSPFAGLDMDGRSVDPGSAATGAAWSAAAGTFGMRVPVEVVDGGWVDADVARGEPLHPPEVVPVDAPVGAPPVEASGPSEEPSGEASTNESQPKPEAHQVIDRIVDRLRSEGLGAETARLIAGYGGYGESPTASRELYAKLRALLMERGTAS